MINSTILIGRLTRDPELRKSQSGTSVLSFNLAVNRKFNKEETDFINCVCFNHTADFISKYLGKGSLISVEGRIQTRNYEDKKTGNRVYVTEVVADSVQSLESRREREKNNTDQNSYQNNNVDIEEEFGSNSFSIDDDSLPF